MAEVLGGGLHDREEDRLPWLESAEDPPERTASLWRVLLLVLVGIAALTGIVWAVTNLRPASGPAGTGELIEAPGGDYKVKPDEPGGMKVEGTGDSVFATSEGNSQAGARLDMNKVPEAPVANRPAPSATATAKAEASGRVVANVPASSGRLEARAPARTAAPMRAAAGNGGSLVQIGSFPNEAEANAAWKRLSKRFAYLAPLGTAIQQAEVNGRTVHRLRVNAGSAEQANELCAKLKMAGEGCFVAR